MSPALYPYQEAGRDFLASHRYAYIGDDPGLGKTAQVVTAADKLHAKRVLILCPASLKVNWVREFRKFSTTDRPVCLPGAKDTVPATGPLVCVVNYDIVIRKGLHEQIAGAHWDVMACDEAHALKNPTSKRTRAVLGEKGLHRAADSVWMMSGTPAPNHPGELYPVLASLYPQALHGLKYRNWLRRYCYVIDTVYGEKVTGNRPEIAELKAALQGFMLRRRRAEVLTELPPLRTGQLTVQNDAALSALERHCSGEIELMAAMLGDDDASDDALDALEETQLSTLRRLCGEAKAHALVPLIAEEMDNGVGKIVLMCWHRSTMDILQAGLAQYGVARIDGSTKNRQEQVDRFQCYSETTPCSDSHICRVFIGQIQAAGVGHTLTAAQDMVIVEPSWTPGDNVQAMLRIHRIGQDKPCLVRFAALAGSIDEAIMRVAERKTDMLVQLLM